MNKQEMEQVGRYLDEADVGAWRSATDAYVTEHNMIIKNGPSAERQQDIDARKRNYAPAK